MSKYLLLAVVASALRLQCSAAFRTPFSLASSPSQQHTYGLYVAFFFNLKRGIASAGRLADDRVASAPGRQFILRLSVALSPRGTSHRAS